MMMVSWPTLKHRAYVEVWRILDLSGLTRSVRESRNYTKSGFVYLNGINVTSFKETISTGEPFYLELRFPNGRVKGEDITVIPYSRLTFRTPRNTAPGTNYSINDPEKLNYRG
jgi:hypothetical protein